MKTFINDLLSSSQFFRIVTMIGVIVRVIIGLLQLRLKFRHRIDRRQPFRRRKSD